MEIDEPSAYYNESGVIGIDGSEWSSLAVSR